MKARNDQEFEHRCAFDAQGPVARTARSQGIRKITVSLGMLLAAALSLTSPAAVVTNDLKGVLQKGLFEEEANHNLGAAIQAYQEVIAQFDQDRKLAATAVFRLAECYRKQGNTNAATDQYRRILREFSDQASLAELSRPYAQPEPPASPAEVRQELAKARVASETSPGGGVPPTTAEAEEVRRIQALIKDSPDLINAKDPPTGRTPLHTAAGKGQLIVAGFLLANGADVNARNGRYAGRTPLHDAAAAGHKAMVELLLGKGAGVDTRDDGGNTPLHLAAQQGFRSVVEVLLAHRADINARNTGGATPLHEAVANGFRAVAELLLARDADVTTAMSNLYENGENFSGTALHVAAQRGDAALAELLLTNQANPNALNGSGDTPLHLAARKGQVQVAAVLLAKGAQVNADNSTETWHNGTPLDYAVYSGQKEMAQLLLKNHADPDARYDANPPPGPGVPARGWTPLLWATQKGALDFVELLLASKADPNLKSAAGTAPIFNALASTSPDRERIIALLLEHGAQVNLRNSRGQTPLMVAAMGADKELLELLLARRQDVNAQDEYGWSALHHLAYASGRLNALPAAELLLAAGADVNLREKNGQTPLNLVSAGPGTPGTTRRELTRLLREHGAVEDLPRLDRIEVRRPSANYSSVVFSKGTNDYNRFTLYELLAAHYGFLSPSPNPALNAHSFRESSYTREGSLTFPNLEKMVIRRPSADGRSRTAEDLNLSVLFRAAHTPGSPCNDLPLEWGDLVEIPEADHPINATWQGLPPDDLGVLLKCLTRHVLLTVKGQSTNLLLAPTTTSGPTRTYGGGGKIVAVPPQFGLLPVLNQSGLLRASSDLSKVRVRRRDAATGQSYELVLDCSNPNAPPDLWLRDGDVIDVPEKP